MKQNEDATQIAAHYFGTLPDNATPDDIYRMKMAIRAVHPNISADTINTMADVALRDPKSIKNGIATLRTIGMSPEAMVSRVQGPPGAGGAPTTIPQTSAVRADGSITTALPPGETQLLEAPASRAEKLQATAGTSPQYHADLENLRQLSKDIPLSGPVRSRPISSARRKSSTRSPTRSASTSRHCFMDLTRACIRSLAPIPHSRCRRSAARA
jgi:hypothetical protein